MPPKLVGRQRQTQIFGNLWTYKVNTLSSTIPNAQCVIIHVHIEGSVHKGSISIYFRFWDFYTIRQISTSPTSL